MPAYFAPGAECNGPARDIPAFDRIRPGRKWMACRSVQNGRQGALCFMGEQPTPGTDGWTTCADGLLYLPGRPIPPQHELGREHKTDGIDYTTSQGFNITIPVAYAAPRKVLFGAGSIGDPSAQFAKDAFALFGRLNGDSPVGIMDPAVLPLIAAAIAHVYYVTPEMLDELGWITTADLDPIICCLMGADPKKTANPAGSSSPSPVGV